MKFRGEQPPEKAKDLYPHQYPPRDPERIKFVEQRLQEKIFDTGPLKKAGTLGFEEIDRMKTQREGPIDMYNMSGFANLSILTEQIKFKIRNLVDSGDVEIQEIQNELLGILATELFELPRETQGLILHSGSEANEAALYMARQATGKNLVLTSNLTHQSIVRACEKLEMTPIQIDVDPETYEIYDSELNKVLKEYYDQLAAVVITTGTTQLGNAEGYGNFFDYNSPEMSLSKKKSIWVHIDAAYGGTIMNLRRDNDERLIPMTPPLIARSITVDPHKFVGVYGCAALLLPNKKDKELIGPEAPYFKSRAAALGTTRSAFEAAVALATMKALGRSGLEKLALQCYERAEWVADELERHGLKIMAKQSGVVPIELDSEKEVKYMQEALKKEGFLVSPIHIKGKSYDKWGIRIVVTPKAEMTKDNLDRFIKATIKVYKEK